MSYNENNLKGMDEFQGNVKEQKSIRVKIIDKLIANGNYYISSIFGNKESFEDNRREALEKLKYIPKSNLEKLYDNMDSLLKSTDTSFNEFLVDASKAGYLSFKPFICENSYGTPTLVLKYNRFVHLFRGYHYQVSYTANGVGEYQAASTRIDYVTSLFRPFNESKLHKMLYYMNCINACYGIDSFVKLLKGNPEIVDKFVKLSTRDIFNDYDITYKDLESLAVECTGNVEVSLGEPIKVYRVPNSETMDICRLKIFTPQCIIVEFMQGSEFKQVLFKLPDWREGLTIDEFDEEYADEFDGVVYSDTEVFTLFVSFVINTVGAVINFMVAYPHSRRDFLKALNNPNVETLENLNKVYELLE